VKKEKVKMNTKFKKGDVVWAIYNWDEKATVSVEQLTIKSFGKVQGTAMSNNTNDMTKRQFYANNADHLYLVSDIADINEFAMQKAIEQKTKKIQHYANCVHKNPDDTRYVNAMNNNCQAVMNSQPTVIFK